MNDESLIDKSLVDKIPPISRALLSISLIGFVLMLLHLATPMLSPILFAFFLVAIAISPFRWMIARGMRRGPALLIMLVVLVAGGIGLALLALTAVSSLQAGLSTYADQLATRLAHLEASLAQIDIEFGWTKGGMAGLGVSAMSIFLSAMAGVAADALISLVIAAFFLFELDRFLAIVRSEKVRSEPFIGQLPEVGETAVAYFGIRTRLNLITGVGVSLICLLIGVDYALLWGVAAFFLSYIPYVGLLAAMVPPALLALAEFGWPQALIVVVTIVFINLMIENVVEPGYTGKRLQLSPTIVFLSFFFWAWLLGPVGGLLSMPITVMMLLVLQSYENTSWLARIIGTSDLAKVEETI